jgi:hypothetical protein
MGTINQKKTPKVQAEKHLNWMGGAGYFLSDPVRQLELAASSCFFGEPQYYHRDDGDKRPKRETVMSSRGSSLNSADLKRLRKELDAVDPAEWRGRSPTDLMTKAIDKALEADPERTLKLAADLRTVHHIRTTPQVILVRAAHHPKVRGTTLLGEFARHVIQRADEPAVGLAYQLQAYGEKAPIPNGLKRAWSRYLEGCKPYELAKYRQEGRRVKLVDVVNLTHPKSEAVGQLVRGELKNTETWEAIISSKGSNQAAWTEALEHMGHMALLRNLRNLLGAGVPHKAFASKLVEGAAKGKQLPFRYFSAYKAVGEAPGPVKDAIEEAMLVSMEAMPKFEGRAMFLADNSGSAWGAVTSSMGTMHVAEIANLTGVIGAHLADEGYVGVFGDRLTTASVSKKGSIFEQLQKTIDIGHKVGESTENGIWLFWDQAIKKREHWDHVFVFSDMQAGHGGLYGTNPGDYKAYQWSGGRHIDVGKLINTYRSKVNQNVNVYLVQVAGYQDTILPEFYKRTYILGGWSEGLFRFAHQMAGLMQVPQAA